MNNSDMPAMPQDADWKGDFEASINSKTYGEPSFYGIGLTKREHFAAMAMAALLSNLDPHGEDQYSDLAKKSIYSADALLKALENSNV